MTRPYFRPDNTEGYTATELVELNAAFDAATIGLDPDDDLFVSQQDHIAAEILATYDRR